jgi:hypothetical protein
VTRIAIAIALVASLAFAFVAKGTPQAHGCAFSVTPHTYEGPQSRGPYLAGEDLAAHNRIAPSDSFFGTPYMEYGVRGARHQAGYPYIPARLLKSIGYIESAMAQAANSVPWASTGPALISFDCGHGISQVTSGMGNPNDAGWPSTQQSLVATHYLYNVGRGAAILSDKNNYAPESRPIAGTDTDGDITIVENWYYAIWSYNGFTGPGANRSNHPMDPIYGGWPRTGFSCGPSNDGYGHSYGNYPYQEIILGCMARPPSVSGTQLWAGLPASLPNLNDSRWSGPLNLNNFTSSDSFARMDMPSPAPWHRDDTPVPSDGADEFLRADPHLSLSRTTVDADVTGVTISNTGSGILAWRARPGQSWVLVDKQAGVALDANVYCAPGNPCTRSPTLTIRRNYAPGTDPGWVDIVSLTTGETQRIWVLRAPSGPRVGDASCDGRVDSVDATFVLQYAAGLIGSLPCGGNADANGDSGIDAVDATGILQYNVGFIASLPP